MSWSIIITIFFVIGSISVPYFTYRYVQKKSGGESTPLKERPQKEDKPVNVKEYIPVQDIWGNMVVLDKNEYVLYIKVGAANFNLMSLPEQDRFESVLIQVANQFKYPTQIYKMAPMVDVSPIYDAMSNNLTKLPNDEVKMYTAHLIDEMDMLSHQRNILDEERYLILNYTTLLGPEKAKGELERRGNSLVRALDRANLRGKILDTTEIGDFLYRVFNRGSTFKPSNAVNSGALEPLVQGRRGIGVVNSEEDIA